MRAIICTRFGAPEQLAVREIPSPTPKPNEIVLAVKAAGVNFRDVLSIHDKYQVRPELPFCPGCEAAGLVTQVGRDVRTWKVGDRVAAFTMWGAFADETPVDERFVVRIPDAMDYRTAAAFLLSYGTADHGLRDRARLAPGETLLVLGASGAAGIAAIEVGKVLGARVIACASTPEKVATCRRHGADETINYQSEDLKQRIRDFTAGRGVDVVYDCVGGAYTEVALRSIAWRGRLVVVGFASGHIPKLSLNLTLLKGSSTIGIWWGDFVRREPLAFAESGRRLNQWYQAGALAPHIARVFPLERAGDALNLIASRQSIGKPILSMEA